MKGVHYIVSGKVQGVGYRFFVYTAAQKYDCVGWVKNLLDGTVEILVEGEEANLVKMDRAIKKGPAFSSIASINRKVKRIHGFSFEEFEILK